MNHMTSHATLVALLVVIGSATLAAWIVKLADELLDRFMPPIREAMRRRANTRAFQRALAQAQPASPAEKRAMREGAEAAIQAFRRAEAAVLQARREMVA